MENVQGIFVEGRWQPSTGNETFTVINPYTEESLGFGILGTAEDVDIAVRSADRAFKQGPWPELSLEQRIEIVQRIGKGVEARLGELADLATLSMGAVYARWNTLGNAVPLIEAYIEDVRKVQFEYMRMDSFSNALIRRRPVGVVAGIVPWNAPVRSELKKVIPAILAGCTIVLKPAPETPFTAAILADIFNDAGVPPGVVNLVPGGAVTGEALITHPLVRKIAFTGSSAVGEHIASVASHGFKRLQLELGGKSAAIVLEDADLQAALPALDSGVFGASGQVCSATTRIIAPRALYDDLVDAITERARQYVLGDPFDASTTMGPLVAERQRVRSLSYIEKGIAEGAKLTTGGGRPADQPRGWFVEPTVFANVDNSMTIARDEIFGPVVSIIPFEDEDEAIRIANDSTYGLGGIVHSSDPHHALAIAKKIDSGNIAINQPGIGATTPYGGVKGSGVGRECGVEGYDSFLEYVPHPVSAEFAKELAKTIPLG